MINTRRTKQAAVLVAALALVGAACGGDDDDASTEASGGTSAAEASATSDTESSATAEETSSATAEESSSGTAEETGGSASSGGVPTYGYAQEFSAYNNNLSNTNSSKNTVVLNEVLPSVYNFAGPTGALVRDEELTDAVNVVSTDPQVIEYVLNADAAWSDGAPIDCTDFVFNWRANNGVDLVLDDNGEPVIDDETGVEVPLFNTAGTTGYEDIDSIDCSEDGKTVTVTYGTVFADWQSLFAPMLPAHIVGEQAGVDDVVAAIEGDDAEAIDAMAEFYNNAWALNPGELKDDIMPSGGRFKIGAWEAGSSITLTPNEAYWGTPANGDVVIRYIAEEAQAQALANGEISVMAPQPTPDLLAQLQGISNAVVETGSGYLYEHFDFNFATPALQDLKVRQAFAKCLPRQQMVDSLIVPLDPSAAVMNNRWVFPFEDGYADTSGGLYDEVDIEGAKALLDEAGVSQPVSLRLGWFDNGGNQRRTDQVALTIESCNQAGFDIVDSGSDTFFDVELDAGDWDIAMFAWSGSPLKSGSSSTFTTGGGNNNGDYTNPAVDDLITQLNAELDPAAQVDLANQIDTILWEDLATIPVFTFPKVWAWTDNMVNAIPNPSQSDVTFNASQWQLS